MTHVPLREVLPRGYLSAEAELRRLADELDSHPSAADRTAWHWYPDHRTEPPLPTAGRLYLLLVDTAITLYKSGSDWLELTLEIAWYVPPKLTVNAAAEVACWLAAGSAMLMNTLASGPFEPHPWRVQAGLPDAPEAIR
jgi:hypothetical protein